MRRLPLNLLDALRQFGASKVLRQALGASAVDSYVKVKLEDWDAHQRHLSAFEFQRTVDC